MKAAALAWQDQGRCKGMPVNIFYPEKVGAANAVEAKRICAGCPIRLACQEYALTHREAGVWGGLTEQERIAMIAARRRRAAREKRTA